jgi:amidase
VTTDSELTYIDATAQAALVRNKEIKPIELVDAAIKLVERLNPTINAVVIEMYEQAREIARGPAQGGPFAGVPFLLKNLLAECAGVEFTQSSAFLRGFVSDEDSELVKRFKRAGLIVIGKTNTPEFGIGATAEPVLYGPTRNPWDTSRTPGGSSGGAGAAVAAGIVPIAHGNDAGGSIRTPASCCGVFGLKPSRGRNPLGPHYGDIKSGLVAEHVLTRTVRDSAAVLDATSGPDLGAPYSVPQPARPFVDEVAADPGRLRIALTTETPLGTPVHPDCVAAARDAGRLCEELGHRVVEAAPSIDGERLWHSFTTMIAAGVTWAIDGWGRRLGRTPAPEDFEPFIWAMYERGRGVSASQYLSAVQDTQRVSRDIAGFFVDYDVWLTPALGEPPVPLGTLVHTGGSPLELRRRQAAFTPFQYIANATGQPAMSVPLSWNADGLPVGTHFAGRYGDEATLFRLAAQLEEARPWSDKRPPVSA